MDFSTIEITSKKVHGNNADFSIIEVILKNVPGKNLDFSTIEVTSKNIRETNIDYLISKITFKKYVEMTYKFVKVWSSTYRRNIHIESTSIQCEVPVGL